MAASATAARTRTINIRIEEERRTLIDRAAAAAGKDRTQFVLDAATREATTVLLDQRYFQLNTDAFAKFNAALDASPAENPRLRGPLSRKAPWERGVLALQRTWQRSTTLWIVSSGEALVTRSRNVSSGTIAYGVTSAPTT